MPIVGGSMMVSLALALGGSAGANPVDGGASGRSEVRGMLPAETDACLAHRAVRRCAALQLAVRTARGSFDGFVFEMHHAQAGVFWFRDSDSGEFMKVVVPDDEDTEFLGQGWRATTADGQSYRVERVVRETYVLRRVTGPPLALD